MTDFHVLVPTATTNYITNPSFENNANGWTAVGSTLTRVLTLARFGRYSLRVVTDGVAIGEGVYFRIDASGISSMMAGSVYARGAGDIRVRVIDGFKGGQSVSRDISLTDNRWTRIQAVGRVGDSNDYRIYIETSRVQAITFYIDGAQIEAQTEATTYCDGSLEGCRWNGVGHASTSQRSAEEMSGGIWTPIRDSECNPDTYVTVMGGVGMPPVRINRQRTALSPGSVFDNMTTLERVITLNVWVKDSGAEDRVGGGQRRIKELRQILTDLIKPDVNPDTNPFYLRITDENTTELTIKCRYEGGLEFDGDVRDIWRNTIPLRLLCLDPFFEEDDQEVAVLDIEENLEDVVFAVRRNGSWEIVGQGFTDVGGQTEIIRAITEDSNGRIYAGGDFTQDGDGNPLRRFFYMSDDFSRMVEAGTGVDDDVYDIAAHPNGKIYLTGAFQNDNAGNPLAYVAEYDPATNSFNAMGAGLDNQGWAIAIAPNGWVYVGGSFGNAGGNPAFRIARWDGLSWHRVGDLDTDLSIWDVATTHFEALIVIDTGEIYGGGLFPETPAGATAIYNVQFDGTTWTEMGDSETAQGTPNSNTHDMLLDVDNTIVIAYETSTGGGGVHRWNGSAYVLMGETISGGATGVDTITLDKDGFIYAGGPFDNIGEATNISRNIAIWNGSRWSHFDLARNATNLLVTRLFADSRGDIYVGYRSTAATGVTTSGRTTVLNYSTKDVFPLVTFTGTGRLLWLENQTTGQRVYLDYTLQEDEVLTLDFRTGKKNVTSNYRGDVPDAILPNSDDFFLAAGNLDDPRENIIHVLIIDEVDPTAQLRYTPTHWSFDASAD